MSSSNTLVRWRLDDVSCNVRPDEHDTPWCLTLDLSREGTGESGAFEWNARYPDLLIIAPPDRVAGDGQRPLLVTHRQGIGDFIQQLRYLSAPQLAGRRILLECPAHLHQLVEAQDIDVEPVEPGHRRNDPSLDEMSNMRLDQRFDDPTGAGPYIKASSAGLRRSAKPLRVGINWSGMLGTVSVAMKSVALRDLEPLVAPRRDIEWVSLQWGPTERELDRHAWGAGVTQRGKSIETVADLAREIAALDLFITIDSAPAHLAGALGVPVWTMLGQAIGWRWRLAHPSSHLYRSMTLFRFDPAHGWPGVVSRVGETLDKDDVRANGARPDQVPQGGDSIAVRFADDPIGTARAHGVIVEPNDHETLAGMLQLLVRCYKGLPWSVVEPRPSPDLRVLGAFEGHRLVTDILAAADGHG